MSYLDIVQKTKEELKKKRPCPDDPGTITAPDATEGRITAVLINSLILGPVWFAFADDFKSGDDIPVFFASELPFLRTMSPEELHRRHAQKRALGGGWIRNKIEATTIQAREENEKKQEKCIVGR